jgi:flagellar basal-body rod protein FlgB
MMPFDSGPVRTLENALDGLAFRQSLMAGNIANASTPGFVVRDVDFRGVMARLDEADPLVATEPGHMDGREPPLLDPWQGATKYGGGPPDVKQQMVAVAENGLHYAAVAQALTQQLARYRMAIREGR